MLNTATFGRAIVPDTALPTPAYAIWVGGAGTVVVQSSRDNTDTVSYTVAASQILPVQCFKVIAAGTTATLLVGLY